MVTGSRSRYWATSSALSSSSRNSGRGSTGNTPYHERDCHVGKNTPVDFLDEPVILSYCVLIDTTHASWHDLMTWAGSKTPGAHLPTREIGLANPSLHQMHPISRVGCNTKWQRVSTRSRWTM